MIKLSVVIITLNEEKNIERCLNSVKDIADEILVVDSFSKDETQNICKKFNVNFIKNNFKGYSAQKKYAVDNAKYKYILSIDADEVISDILKLEILNLKNNWQYDGYYFNRLSNYCGKWIKHCGWYPDSKLRLFDRTKGKWSNVMIHESFKLTPESKTKLLKGNLLHYTCDSIFQHIQTINNYSEIDALAKNKKNKNINIFEIIFSPIFKFIKMYFIKLGFLDGYYGFIISVNSAHSTFLKKIKLRELNKKNKQFIF